MDDEYIEDLRLLLPRFLGPLPNVELIAFATRLHREFVASGTRLYRQGEASDCMHFVVTGRLGVWTHDRYGDRRLVAHLSRHNHAFEDAAGGGTRSDRTHRAMELRTVAHRTATSVEALDRALKSFTD